MIKLVKSGNTNCYILGNKNMAGYVLVDAGTTQDKDFIKKLESSGMLSKIGLLILTHGHYDHVGHASVLQEKFKIPVAMHRKDVVKVEHGSMEFPPAKGIISGFIRKLMIRKTQNATYPKFKPDIILDTHLKIKGFSEIKILYLPGHTQGSIGIVFEKHLLAGDLVMNMPFPSTTWFAEDFVKVQKSVRSISRNTFLRIYPGHGSSFSGKLLTSIFPKKKRDF